MRYLHALFAGLLLALLVLAPAAVRADERDDLDVTMEVLDTISDLDEAIAEMDGPDDSEVEKEDWESEEQPAYEDHEHASARDGDSAGEEEYEDELEEDFEEEFEDEFEHGDEDETEDEMEYEDDFEDGEDVDEDEFDDDDEEDDEEDDEPVSD